jgi:tRNA threonylcarbamoyladenosine biosynthesis protein TsaE
MAGPFFVKLTDVDIQSVEEMKAIGAKLGAHLRAGDLILLSGPLGAGKTAFTQGIASFLGIENVTSPTFVISRIHGAGDTGLGLLHIDAYRLQGQDGGALFDDLDLVDYLATHIAVVEWGEGLVEYLSDQYLEIILGYGADENERTLELHGVGPRWQGFEL